MKNQYLVSSIVAGVVGLLVVSTGSAQAAFTLTLQDGAGHSLTLGDNGTGEIVYIGALANSIWTANIDVALTKPAIGGPLDPQMEISVQAANSTAPGTLTLIAQADGFGPMPFDTGLALLNIGGSGDNGSVSASAQVNGVTVLSLGPLASRPWSGGIEGGVGGLSAPFSIGETITITHVAAGSGKQGDFDFSIVPEPSTGTLLLLPFALCALRSLRQSRRG